MKFRVPLFVSILVSQVVVGVSMASAASSAPPAPVLTAPARNASVVQPVSLTWARSANPTPIVSYRWEVGTSSTFTSVVLAGNATQTEPGSDAPTQASVSGLPNGTYFWHVSAAGNDPVTIGRFSAPRPFTITGSVRGTLPAPTLLNPPDLFEYHPLEAEHNDWTAVPGADHYLLEYDNEPSFSLPLFNDDFSPIPASQTSFPIYFGEPVGNLWFRVRAVAADGTRSLPSNVRQAVITYSAPIPPAPVLTGPRSGTVGTVPITLDWADDTSPNTYELQIGSDPTFRAANHVECTGVEWCVRGIAESQWTVPRLSTGVKYWRVRSEHGVSSPTKLALSAWSAVRSFTVQQRPPTITTLSIDVLTDNGLTVKSHTNAPSGTTPNNQVFGRLELDPNLPPEGTTVTLTSSDPSIASVPDSVLVPRPSSLDATAALASFPIDPKQVTSSRPVTITATLPTGSLSVPLTVDPPSVQLFTIGATTVSAGDLTGSLTLAGAAPPGGASITFTSSKPALLPAPATLTIPAGGYTAPVTVHMNPVATTRPVRLTATMSGVAYPLDLTIKPAPSRLAPADGAGFASGAPVRFDWTDELTGDEIEVSTSPAFDTTVLDQFIFGASEYTTSTLPDGTLYWRARGYDDDFRPGPWSTTGMLSVGATINPTLPAPALKTPIAGARIQQAKPVTFTWSNVPGAVSYLLQVDNSSGFTAPLSLLKTVTGTSFTTGALPRAELSWRVRAIDSAGSSGRWSRARSLTVR